MNRTKPRMTLSLDLDNKWSFLKTHGSPDWESYPSYFDFAVPRILEFLKARDVRITFFLVGQDLVREENRRAVELLKNSEHEIANHSFNHDPWLHLYSKADLHQELEVAEDAIATATGRSVRGFRGPGFSLSSHTLEVLTERGYEYDATAFPNILNPLARAYFFSKSQLSTEQKHQRRALFGSYSDAFRPVKPYHWQLDKKQLLEIPVTTMPLFRIPMHFSYLLYLAGKSEFLASLYLRLAVLMCRLTRTEPSLLLHPLDFLGVDDSTGLDFFPAMDMVTERKLALMHRFFARLESSFVPLPMGDFVSAIASQPTRMFAPRFAHDNRGAP